MIQINHITKQFGDQVILKDICLNIEDGIIMGLIGPNGAGKSTLLRIIAGIYQGDLGNICFDGVRIFDEPDCKKEIVLIGDDPFYFFNSSLFEMKEFYKVWYPDLDESVYQSYVKQFQLNEHKAMGNYSKGMLKQAYIIIGLAIAPRYLLLDEAFDGLDPMMRIQFKRAIAQRIEEKKMSVLISSHDLKEMQDLCDSFVMLDHGVLDTSGTMSDVLDGVHKFQLAFKQSMEKRQFEYLQPLHIEIESRVVNMIVKGDALKIQAYLETLEPLMLEILPVSLEELFIYEVEQKGGMMYE